jgi:hypothetical protein
VKPLDQVIRDRIAPVLKDAGFRRKGRLFWLETSSGGCATVDVISFRLGYHDAEFFVEIDVEPGVYSDFCSRRGAGGGGLWWDRLRVPGKPAGRMSDLWSINIDDDAAGQQLTETLRQALPQVLDLLDHKNMLAFVQKSPDSWRRIRPHRDVAITLLLAEEGPSAELDQRLAELEATDPTDKWAELSRDLAAFVRKRLAGESTGRADPAGVESAPGVGDIPIGSTGSFVLAGARDESDLAWIGGPTRIEASTATGGPWVAASYDDDEFWEHEQILTRLVQQTRRPALMALCLDSNFLGVVGLSPDGAWWSGVVDSAAANTAREEGLGEGYDNVVPEFSDTEESVVGAMAWARDAGLTPQESELRRIFTDGEWVQPADHYLGELLAAIGLDP